MKYAVVASGKCFPIKTYEVARSSNYETARKFACAVDGNVVDSQQLEFGRIVILNKPMEEKKK